MGQGQSQQAEALMSEWDPSISPEERAHAQADVGIGLISFLYLSDVMKAARKAASSPRQAHRI
jgi:hypothetical protein